LFHPVFILPFPEGFSGKKCRRVFFEVGEFFEFDVKTKEKGIELAKKMENAVIEINGDANEQGHLYGSIDAKRIANEINNRYHLGISEDNINLPQHLKATGKHEVEIEFHPEVKTKMKVIVTSIG